MSLGGKKKPKKPSGAAAKATCGGENKPIDTQIKRLQELAAIPRAKRTAEQKTELCNLLGNTGPDADFEKRDKKNRKRLKKELKNLVKNDPLVANASEHWNELSEADKKKVIKKILAAQRKAYVPKMAAPKVVFVDNPPSGGYITNGSYKHSTNTISVNLNSQAKAGTSFEKAVGLLCHEQAHKYQNLLADRVKSGKIGPSSPYFRQGQIFAANGGNGYQSTGNGDSFDCYHGQSLERHSHTAEDTAVDAVDDAMLESALGI